MKHFSGSVLGDQAEPARFMRRLHRSPIAALASVLLAIAFGVQGAPAKASTPLSGATQVGAGGCPSCVVTGSGGVQCWGWNAYGQLGNGTTVDAPVAVDTTGLGSGVIAIATGGTHTCAVTSGGGLKCWAGTPKAS